MRGSRQRASVGGRHGRALPSRVKTSPPLEVPRLSAAQRECLAAAADGGIVAPRDYRPAAELCDMGLVSVSFLSSDEYRFVANAAGRRLIETITTPSV